MTVKDKERVCVTGASGYIGTHVARELLERGYRVRGVVRDVDDPAKTAHLRALPGADERLELAPADLLAEGSHDPVVKGCPLVCHTAASVRMTAKNPQRDIVDPAVKGTRFVLESVARAGDARRVVLTSSVAAMEDDSRPQGHRFTEDEWNESATLKIAPYPLGKTLSERAAWKMVEDLEGEQRFELITICPSFVLGPVLAEVHVRSSPTLIRDLMVRTFPACPQIKISAVDVREVAAAHVEALERPEASGRYILSKDAYWMQELGEMVARLFPDYPVPTGKLPNFVMYAAGLFDKRINWGFLRRFLNREVSFDGERVTRELGIQYRPMEQTLEDTCRSFIKLGVDKK